MGRLDGKVALITGGASGMGRVACELFAAEGARVVVVDVTDAGEEVAASITAAGNEAAFVQANVASADDCTAMVDFAVERFGGLHVLYNNAGSSRPTTAARSRLPRAPGTGSWRST